MDGPSQEGNQSSSNQFLTKTITVLSDIVNSHNEEYSETDQDGALNNYVKLFVSLSLSDHLCMLSPFVELLKARPSGESLDFQSKICDTLCRLVAGNEPGIRERFGKWKEIITNELTSETVNVFKALETLILMPTSNVCVGNRKLAACINLTATILNCNAYVKKSFDEVLGVKKLKADLMLYNSMSSEVGSALLQLLTVLNKDGIKVTERVITITDLVSVIIQLIPLFDTAAQRLVSESVRIMCASVLQNRLICCHIGLISDILKLLENHGRDLADNIKDCLISIMEILGCLSITSAELKLLISLFRMQTDGSHQFTHGDRLVQSLERMASQNVQFHTQYQPQCFINLYDVYSPTSVRCPSIQCWNGKGITIHTWLCMDFTLPDIFESRRNKLRHVLYFFLNSRGEGFEAFFTEEGFLVLAVHTKKEFLTTTVTSSPFNDQEWHGVTIAHTRKLLGRAVVTVYVDGQEIHSAQLQYPTVGKEITHSYIGYGVKTDSNFHYQIHPPFNPARGEHEGPYPEVIAAGLQNQVWGMPSILKGQMSSFVLFNESWPVERIQELSAAGPNYKHLFIPKHVLSEAHCGDTASLLVNVVFHFDAKASYGDETVDLHPAFRDKTFHKENLKGSIHRVWSIQESIQSLGGLAVLFPLLEQACFRKCFRAFSAYKLHSTNTYTINTEVDDNNKEHVMNYHQTCNTCIDRADIFENNNDLRTVTVDNPTKECSLAVNNSTNETNVLNNEGELIDTPLNLNRASSVLTNRSILKQKDAFGCGDFNDNVDFLNKEAVAEDTLPRDIICSNKTETAIGNSIFYDNDENNTSGNVVTGDVMEENVATKPTSLDIYTSDVLKNSTDDLSVEPQSPSDDLPARRSSKNTFKFSTKKSPSESENIFKIPGKNLPAGHGNENMHKIPVKNVSTEHSGSKEDVNLVGQESESPNCVKQVKKSSVPICEWTFLECASPQTRSDTFKSWAKQDNHDLNGVSHFISLIKYMIGSHKHGKKLFIDLPGIKVIGLLLQSCHPNLINVGFLDSVAQLVESIIDVKDALRESVFRYIVFEFEIWYKADISVQIAHTQLLHTYIKDEPELFSKLFGVGFFFRMIQLYYCKSKSKDDDLSESDARDLRKALLGLIFYMIKLSPRRESLNFVISYMATLSQHEHLDEVLELLYSIVKIGNGVLNAYVTEASTYIVYRWMVHDIPNATRLKILDILINLLEHGKLIDSLRQHILLKPNLFAAVGELLCKQEVSRDVVIHLLKFGMSFERSVEQEADIYSDFTIVLTVVRIAQFLPRPIKLEVAIKIRSSLKLINMSAERCANEVCWYEPLWRLILTENSSPSDMDVMEAELVQVVIEIVYNVMWSGIIGSDAQAWIKRCEPLSSLHDLSSRNNTFLLPVLVVERQLLEMCLQASANALKNSDKLFAVDSQNAAQILKLVDDFIFSSELGFVGEESHKWSLKLLSNLFVLLDAMNAWEDSTECGMEWVEAVQIVERILYKCCQQDNVDLVVAGNNQLALLLSKHPVQSIEEASYQMFHLNDVLRKSIRYGVSCENLVISLYPRYEKYYTAALEDDSLLRIPIFKLSSFKKDYIAFMDTEEYYSFVDVIAPISKKYHKETFLASSLEIGRLWMDSLNAMTKSLHQKEMDLENSLQCFSKTVYQYFEEKRNEECISLEEYKKSCRQKNGVTKNLWQYQKRFLTSERGAWKLIENPSRHFKLSNTENRYRMRLKLTENLKYNSHVDASRQRDTSSGPDMVVENNRPVSLPFSTSVNDSTENDDDKLLSPTAEDVEDDSTEIENVSESSHLYDLQAFDKVTGSCIHSSECRLVTLMDVVPGRIELTATHLCYYDDKENMMESTYDFNFELDELREIYSRRYNLRRTSMEFFLLDRSSFFVNFPSVKDKETFYRKIIHQKPKHLYYSGIQTPSKLLRVSRLTNKWVEREISNFEYLMQLNTISGRTYNDLAQYPVFPWILIDYTSDSIDLEDELIYRDLSKPVGILNEKKAEDIKIRYESFVDVSGMSQKSHYFTHYSNPGGVLHYLVRVEPFTSLHIHLQSGKFDCADRLFYALQTSWESALSGSDVMELIPEFFFFAEFLINLNGFNLGQLQNTGESISNVKLPPWAKDAYDFVNIHRQALESEYVSANLHSWIDLIFGYKQRGKEAEKALNVFSHYTYEGAVDLDLIEDPVLREATEGMINNFGQTPTQLLKKPHPKRKTLKEIDSGKPIVTNHLESSTFSLIEILHMVNPVIFIAACKPRPKSILYQAVPDTLITVHVNGLFGTHAWYTDPKTNSFSFTMDVLLASSASHSQRLLPGTISPSLEYSSRLFAFTADGHLMLSCGYWDSSIRLVNTDRGKDRLKLCVNHHNDVVTCISLDVDGSHLISGSADLTCAVWKIEQVNGFSAGLSPKPIQILYGHDSCITAVAMHGDLDLAASGAKDGVCLIHTIRKGIFLHTLRPMHPDEDDAPSTVIDIKISHQGRIIILSNLFGYDMPHHFISMHSMNGSTLGNVVMNQVIRDICIVNDYLVIGSMSGTLQMRQINDLSAAAVLSKNVKAPIFTVAATHNGSHIFIGRGDGNILVMCPSKQ